MAGGSRRWRWPSRASGLWLTGRLDDAATPAQIVLALGLAGFGSGLFIVANMHYVMGAVAAGRQGAAGGLVSLMRTGGIVVGASLTTAVYSAGLSAHAHLGARGADAAAFAGAFWVAAAIAAAAALLSLVPPRARSRPAAPCLDTPRATGVYPVANGAAVRAPGLLIP